MEQEMSKPEMFRTKTGEKVRIASRSGHVVIIGKEFRPVPAALAKKALAAGCIPKSLYDELREEVKKELASGDGAPALPEDEETPAAPPADRKTAILLALERIRTDEADGKVETPAGNKLTHQGKPVLAAVAEYAGLEVVKMAEVEEALA
jgi:hypothetical protein